MRHHLIGFGGADNLHLRIEGTHLGDAAGVVGFQMMHDEIVGLTACEGFLQVLLPLCHRATVAGVHDGHLLIKDDIGVIAHTVGRVVLVFKQVLLGVIDTDVADVCGDVLLHSFFDV